MIAARTAWTRSDMRHIMRQLAAHLGQEIEKGEQEEDRQYDHHSRNYTGHLRSSANETIQSRS